MSAFAVCCCSRSAFAGLAVRLAVKWGSSRVRVPNGIRKYVEPPHVVLHGLLTGVPAGLRFGNLLRILVGCGPPHSARSAPLRPSGCQIGCQKKGGADQQGSAPGS